MVGLGATAGTVIEEDDGEPRKKTTERTSWKELQDRELQVRVAEVVVTTLASRG